MIPRRSLLSLPILLAVSRPSVYAASPDPLFREDWAATPAEVPLTQQHVSNPGLTLHVYGPGAPQLKKSNHPEIPNDPYYVWSGLCTGTWLVALEPKSAPLDLSAAGAKVRWRAKQSGFRSLRLALHSTSGDWIVSEQADPASGDWRIAEFALPRQTWKALVLPRIYEAKPVDRPDLRAIDQIGFTDLMPGGQSAACSRLDWIEVYG